MLNCAMAIEIVYKVSPKNVCIQMTYVAHEKASLHDAGMNTFK